MSVLRGIIGMLCIAGLLVLIVGCGKKETSNTGSRNVNNQRTTTSGPQGTAPSTTTTNTTSTTDNGAVPADQGGGVANVPLPAGTRSDAKPLTNPRPAGVVGARSTDPSNLPGVGASTQPSGK